MDVEHNIFRVVLADAAFEALVTGGDVIMEPADGVEVRIFWARHTRRRLAQPNGPHMSTAHSIFPL